MAAYTATGYWRRCSPPRMVSRAPETRTQTRAHTRAMRCCVRPVFATSEARSAKGAEKCGGQKKQGRLEEVGAPAVKARQRLGARAHAGASCLCSILDIRRVAGFSDQVDGTGDTTTSLWLRVPGLKSRPTSRRRPGRGLRQGPGPRQRSRRREPGCRWIGRRPGALRQAWRADSGWAGRSTCSNNGNRIWANSASGLSRRQAKTRVMRARLHRDLMRRAGRPAGPRHRRGYGLRRGSIPGHGSGGVRAAPASWCRERRRRWPRV